MGAICFSFKIVLILPLSPALRLTLGGVAEWIRCSVSNLVGYTRVGSNPVADSANHKPAANSAVHPSEVGK